MPISKNQPKGLFLLFFVEMWERFSYYGMRALLVLYMLNFLNFSMEKSGRIYGWYTGMVYLTPLIGGYIADRYWGQRRAILIGSLLMALGHFSLAFPALPFFFTGLILLIMGNGFFKPNISTVVGSLYEENDPRRDAGFTIFYMGINLGAFFSPFVCSTLGEKVGWHWGFSAAGIGMLLGLMMYLWGQKQFLGDKCMKAKNPQKNYSMPIILVSVVLIFLILSAFQFSGYEIIERVPKYIYWITAILVVTGFIYAYTTNSSKSTLTRVEKQRIAVIFIMVFFSIFFWSAFEQAGSSLTIFADKETNRNLSIFGFNFVVPTGYFQSINPLLIFLLAPLFSKLWIRLADVHKEPSSPLKFSIGLGFLSVGFMVMVVAAKIYEVSGPVSMLWLIGAYFFHTLGELCLSPVGLSLVTKLSPVQFTSLMMGVWFLSSFVANFVGGFFAGNYDAMNHSKFFMIPMTTAILSALLLFLLTPRIRKWMHGIH